LWAEKRGQKRENQEIAALKLCVRVVALGVLTRGDNTQICGEGGGQSNVKGKGAIVERRETQMRNQRVITETRVPLFPWGGAWVHVASNESKWAKKQDRTNNGSCTYLSLAAVGERFIKI